MNESASPFDPGEMKTDDEQSGHSADLPLDAEVPGADDTARTDSMETDPLDPTASEALSSIVVEKGTQSLSQREPRLKVAKRCHVGAVRERNEDSCLVFMSETGGHFRLMPFGLYVVADGMGGHKNGHVASKIASRVAARHVIQNIYIPLLQIEELPNQTPIQEVLVDAVEAAHTAVYDPDPERDSGTTLSLALVLGRRLYVAHVGDTRVYLQTEGKLEAITIDHSLVQRLQEVGQLTAEEAPYYQYRHVLLRALGQGEELEIDTYTRRLPENGKLLLCTDGLSGFVPDTEILEIMEKDASLDEMAERLFETAMEAGGYDNITAVLVEFTF